MYGVIPILVEDPATVLAPRIRTAETVRPEQPFEIQVDETSGRTMSYLLKILEARKPKSMKLATLLDKPSRRVCEVNADYTGFEVEDKFVIGFGLDFAQKYRNLPYIGVVDEIGDE